MPVIYKITSPTNKIYIGQSWDFIDRIKFYKRLHCKLQTKIYNSLVKYGYDNHIIEIIHTLPEDIKQCYLDSYELLYWQLYKDCDFEMLNIREPGRGGKLSEETKIKIKNKLKGRTLSENHKKKVTKALYGRTFSIETRKKIGDSNKGENNGMFGKTGKLSHSSKVVINTFTNQIFNSVKEAEEFYNMKKNTLAAKLNGRAKNNTMLKYI
jgi:group I intron endonuclease